MSQTDVIKEFLVALGFKVDSSSYKKFKDSTDLATKSVLNLGEATAVAVTGTTIAIAKISEVMEQLYYVGQRTGSAVSSIKSFDYGISQLGGSVDAAQSSLENLGHFIRAVPGSAQFLERLGVAPEHVKDAAAALKDLIPVLTAMPQYQGLIYANILGMDEKTFLALTSGQLADKMSDYNQRLKEAGVNQDAAAVAGKDFMQALRGIDSEVDILATKLEEKLGPWATRRLQEMDGLLRDLVNDPGAVGNTFLDAGKGAVESVIGKPGGVVKFTGADRNQADLYNRLRFDGWSEAAAKGIVQRAGIESGFDPAASGDNHTAYGLFQMHKDWRREFKKWSGGHDIFGAGVVEQADFLDWALRHSTDKDALATGRALQGSTNQIDAYKAFTNGFEKPAHLVGADSGSPATISATTTINVNGAGNPSAVASEVATQQNNVNKNLIRYSGGPQ